MRGINPMIENHRHGSISAVPPRLGSGHSDQAERAGGAAAGGRRGTPRRLGEASPEGRPPPHTGASARTPSPFSFPDQGGRRRVLRWGKGGRGWGGLEPRNVNRYGAELLNAR